MIVEKLAEDGDGFYERLLEKFEECDANRAAIRSRSKETMW
nr:hypothetical protein [Halapricum desulfuricans]